MKINTSHLRDHSFLHILTSLDQAPATIYYKGTLPDKKQPVVAIVGTRKPTAYGKEVTYRLAYDLARKGVIIVSGLAFGVDAIAHTAALDAGGTTIAVLANGVNHVYPASNQNLARRILDNGGAILSEYEPGVQARSFQFLARNRIVSGLSDGVIVTEAARRSGTLSTVHHALDQNREVFAVPGNITSPLSAGCNAIIKQGAHPISSAEDVLEVIAPDLLEAQATLALGNDPAQVVIIQLIQKGIRDGDQLLEQSGLDTSEYLQSLTMLELDGTIRPLGGNQWTLR